MSIAGKRSLQGDEYQLRVAVHWAIRMLGEPEINSLQAESTGLPSEGFPVSVDDVVISFVNGRRVYVQTKKNQSEYSTWSLSDATLQDELLKARAQLESDPGAEVWFYSQTPFGDLHRLADAARSYPDHNAFVAHEAAARQRILARFATLVARDHATALSLSRRIHFGPAHTQDEWDRQNRADLARLLPNPALALDVLERLVGSHEANLRDAPTLLSKEDLTAALAAKGLYAAPPYQEAETIAEFRTASAIGRKWIRTIDGERFRRPEVAAVFTAIAEGHPSVVITDKPGGGKTCVLLDLAEQLEADPGTVLLFIKADLFAEAASDDDLRKMGLPSDIVGRCARLVEHRRVVVIVDSLDVLSLHRAHGSLKLFLGLLDRLQTIDGVTIVGACRDFDLHYDPLLRARTWGRKITIEPLDFDSQVAPLLSRWGVEPGALEGEFKALLQVPQHLRIFEKVARNATPGLKTVASAYHLYDRYLQEVVAADPLLGAPAMAALAIVAERLINERKLTVPRLTLAGWIAGHEPDRLVQRLISQQVLSEPHPGTISFSHQTLLDCLAVHAALARGETLLTFIKDKLPVPFIRPTVRVFFFYLRAQDPSRFWQQVRATLNDESLAYHLRRLIAESLAEITPSEDDWPSLRGILRDHPDLFAQLLMQTRGDSWLKLLTGHVLPTVRSDATLSDTWVIRVVAHLRSFLQTHPTEVIAAWREIWEDFVGGTVEGPSQVVWSIASALDAAGVWASTPGARELLEALLDGAEGHRHTLGRAIAHFVGATNDGDDLLWRYLTPPAGPETLSVDYDAGDTVTLGALRFARHDVPDGFLEARLAESDWLLDRFVETVLAPRDTPDESERETDQMRADGWIPGLHLNDTSYRRRHVRGVVLPYGSEHFLFDVLEQALKTRAEKNDAWWREHEPLLRRRRDLALRYLLIQAYRSNPEANGEGAAEQLCDPDLLKASDLRHELGELIRDVYPYVESAAQDQHQTLVLARYRPDETDDWWEVRARGVYEFLQWVPRPFRLLETQQFLDRFEPRFGSGLPMPRLHMWDSTTAPPISADQLLDLSEQGVVRLAEFFDPVDTDEDGRYEHLRGRHALQRVFRDATEVAPIHMLGLAESLKKACVHTGYIEAIAEGVTNHLRYRFANVSRSGGQPPREPLPDGEDLAVRLLQLIDEHPSLWEFRSTISHACEACAHILIEDTAVSRLISFLDRFSSLPEDRDRAARSSAEGTNDVGNERLLHEAINGPRGIAAGAAVQCCNHLIEHQRPVPELLVQVVLAFAADPEPSTRVGVLHQLPYTVSARPDIGWAAFELIFQQHPQIPDATMAAMWTYAEPVLYFHYRMHYGRVGPLLTRVRSEAFTPAAETYGRIAALSWLAGHLSDEEIFAGLADAPVGAWMGTAQVLCANLDAAAHRAKCHQGLLSLLRSPEAPIEAISHIAHSFGGKGSGAYLTSEVALALISASESDRSTSENKTKKVQLSGVADWVAHESSRNPLSALTVVEALTGVLERENRMALYNAEELVTALAAALREADEVEDRDLLLRVLSVQDRLLRLGISEVDELLNRAARP